MDLRHQDSDGAWGGIQPPWIYSLMALHTEGYPLDHAVLHNGLDAWNHHWSYQRDGATYLQASESPVWDTLHTLQGLLDCDATGGDLPANAAGPGVDSRRSKSGSKGTGR